ncbi:MAG: hypothetical protein ACKO24_19845 [Leptolyngbyaceae cyanobacterium]
MKKLIAMTLFVAAPLAACAPQTPSLDQAKTTYCSALVAFDQASAKLQATMTPSATVGQLKQAQQAVDKAYEGVAAASAQLKEVKQDDIQAAYKDLQRTVNGISDKATLQQAFATVQPKAAALQSAVQTSRTAVQCP